MTTKEMKNLAKKIAKLELEARDADPSRQNQIETEIMKLCGKVHSIEEMTMVDDFVQEILSKIF